MVVNGITGAQMRRTLGVPDAQGHTPERYRVFNDASVILLLNKEDIFREKLLYAPLSKWIPVYKGPDLTGGIYCTANGADQISVGKETPAEADTVIEANKVFILNLFNSVRHRGPTVRGPPVYPHFTCATDVKLMSRVLGVVTSKVLGDNLRLAGLV